MFDDEPWVIWNGSMAFVDTAAVGRIEVSPDGSRMAYLDEPYEMAGPFALDELETKGVIRFSAVLIMSRNRWREDQDELRRAAWSQRAQAQARARAYEARAWQAQRRTSAHGHRDERGLRELLSLPVEGRLEADEIQRAFRKAAKTEHPDAGGRHEDFIRLIKARDALLQAAG